MKLLLKLFLFACSVIALIAIFVPGAADSLHSSLSTLAPIEDVPLSNQPIDAYDLSRNPYMLNGQGGLLKTNGRANLTGRDDERQPFDFPAAALRYSNMIDERTAIYDVLIVENTIRDVGDQMAVILPKGSQRPEPGKPWRVVVQAPEQVVNGLGATRQIAAVRFVGYAALPAPQTPHVRAQSEAVPEAAQQEVAENATWDPFGEAARETVGTLRYNGSELRFQARHIPVALSVKFTENQLARITDLLSPDEPLISGAFYRIQIPVEAQPEPLRAACRNQDVAGIFVGEIAEPGKPVPQDPLLSWGKVYLAFVPKLIDGAESENARKESLCGTLRFTRQGVPPL